jgi:hypothetical protein
LSLLAVLPNANSNATQFIKSSLPGIDFEHCIYRDECDEAASSYIIRSEQSGSRTIVNHNDLAEMTVTEFIKVADHFLSLPSSQGTGAGEWWHFEVCDNHGLSNCDLNGLDLVTTGPCAKYYSAMHAIPVAPSPRRQDER